MEYLQSFLIVVMEMVCFFLFQDAFVPTEKKHKSGFYALWILALSFSALIMSYLFEDSFIVKEIAMIVLFFCSIVFYFRVKNYNRKAARNHPGKGFWSLHHR